MTNPYFPGLKNKTSWPAPTRPDEQRAVAALAFEDAERRLAALPEEVEPYQRLVAWRITREVARVRGLLLTARESLSSLTVSQWLDTDEQAAKPRPLESDRPTDHARRLAWSEPLACPREFSRSWTYLAEFVAAYLAVPHNGPMRAALGNLLEDPTRHWPAPAALADYDEQFIEAVSRRLLKRSRAQVVKALQSSYGLLPHEARELTSCGATAYEYLVTGNKTAQRGLLLARLDDFAHRMREAMHPREEFQALKEMGTVLGLKQPEKEAEEEDMTDVIDRVAAEDEDTGPRPDPMKQIDVRPPG